MNIFKLFRDLFKSQQQIEDKEWETLLEASPLEVATMIARFYRQETNWNCVADNLRTKREKLESVLRGEARLNESEARDLYYSLKLNSYFKKLSDETLKECDEYARHCLTLNRTGKTKNLPVHLGSEGVSIYSYEDMEALFKHSYAPIKTYLLEVWEFSPSEKGDIGFFMQGSRDVLIKTGFAYGYGGTGPRCFTSAVQLLERNNIQFIYHVKLSSLQYSDLKDGICRLESLRPNDRCAIQEVYTRFSLFPQYS